MRVKNDYIIINNGKKEIKIHNIILNTYVSQIISNQFITVYGNRQDLDMKRVYLRLDDNLDFDKTSVLSINDFNLRSPFRKIGYDLSPSQCVMEYSYLFDNEAYNVYDIDNEDYITSLEPYVGKKITAIGFGNDEGLIYACVDTSLYGLYIEDATEVFSINRRDIIATDTIFYASYSRVKGPLHVFNGQEDGNQYDKYIYAMSPRLFGVLYSVGVGIIPNNMNVEVPLIPYEQHLEIETNKINILDEFDIEYNSEGLFPAMDLYPSTTQYPERIVTELYPSEDIYPAIDMYPVEAPYQYMQLKYKIYRYERLNYTDVVTDTGDYYVLSKPIQRKNKVKMNIEYIGS